MGYLTVDGVLSDYREWSQRNRALSCWTNVAIGICFLVAIIVVIAVSLHRLESDEYGIKYNTLNKQLSDEAMEEGLHSGPPGFQFLKFKSTYSTVEIEGVSCVSKDGLLVEIEASFQFLPDKTFIKEIVLAYRNADRFRKAIVPAGISAINHGCGVYSIQSFQGERGRVQQTMLNFLKEKLEGVNGTGGMYAIAVDVQLKNVVLPQTYELAVRTKQSAEEDIELAVNQRKQLITQATTALKAAEEEKKRTLDAANNDATIELTEASYEANTTRLFFKTESDVYRRIQEELELTPQGFLAYLSNRALEGTAEIDVAITEPAPGSYRDQLDG